MDEEMTMTIKNKKEVAQVEDAPAYTILQRHGLHGGPNM
jgi:hypothetical protein